MVSPRRARYVGRKAVVGKKKQKTTKKHIDREIVSRSKG